jgi:23S rRNA pseudouridine1911/1915/1917 synthase
MLKLEIIYEDNNFLVINKPAGLLVQPTKFQKKETLIDLLLKNYPEIKNVGQKERPGIVHRLDKDVSGLMVIAKNQKAFNHLIQQFKENKIKKEYIALVFGSLQKEKGLIDLPIGRTKKGKLVAIKYKKKIKFEKPALTEYEVIKKYQEFTLLKVKPLTGRTHQIRLHLKSINHPIVGDKKYSFKNLKSKVNLDRIFLHANYLGFLDLEGKYLEFKIDLPTELIKFLENLK